MMSGKAGLSDAVKATKLGAFNFLEKPLSPEGVLLALASALELRRARREARALREDLGLAGEMIGASSAMARVREMIARVAPTDARVLITGESGTGKELVAAAIHAQSPRRDRPFVRVNCAAIPRDLVESEMFGHEKGAFTGATDRRIGRFELAHTGTLFLDEVGDLGAEAQAKLLRAIEAKEIERVGGAKPIRIDVRIVAATNKDLDARRDGGRVPRGSALPPERDPDRGAAAARAARRHPVARRTFLRPAPRPDRASRASLARRGALSLLARYRGRATCASWRTSSSGSRSCTPAATSTSRSYARCSPWTADVRRAEPLPDPTALDSSLSDTLDDHERTLIVRALSAAGGNVAEASRRLKTDRPNLYRRMRRLGIPVGDE